MICELGRTCRQEFERMRRLVASMAERFPGGRLAFDVARENRRQADAQDLGEADGHHGHRRVLLREGCASVVGALVAAALRFQLRVHAGLPEAQGAGRTARPPPSCPVRRLPLHLQVVRVDFKETLR